MGNNRDGSAAESGAVRAAHRYLNPDLNPGQASNFSAKAVPKLPKMPVDLTFKALSLLQNLV